MKGEDFTKNLVELSQQKLDTISGGSDFVNNLVSGVFMSPVGSILLVIENGLTPFLGSACAFAVEFLTVYGIGKGIKKLFSSSKKSTETENI